MCVCVSVRNKTNKIFIYLYSRKRGARFACSTRLFAQEGIVFINELLNKAKAAFKVACKRDAHISRSESHDRSIILHG